MKRTLLEILVGSAVGMLLFSLHQQVARLRVSSSDLASLKSFVHDNLPARRDDRLATLRHLEQKLDALEVRVAEASAGETAAELERVLARERDEYGRFKQEVLRDVQRTQTLVDAYVDEMRTSAKHAQATLAQTRTRLAAVADRVEPDHRLLSQALLAPTVQLNGDDTVGSGTLVFSGPNPKSGVQETYVLTAYHVVRNILADTPSARTDGVLTTLYRGTGRVDLRSDMIVHEQRIDAALLKLRSDERFTDLAAVSRPAAAGRVEVWDAIVAVGCPLGNDPIPTHGAISSLKNELNGTNYWMINAPTYFGNSGGGIYRSDTRELIGVFSKIYTHGKGNPVVIPHMGLCTPITAIHEWLAREKLGWVLEGAASDIEVAGEAEAAAPPK